LFGSEGKFKPDRLIDDTSTVCLFITRSTSKAYTERNGYS